MSLVALRAVAATLILALLLSVPAVAIEAVRRRWPRSRATLAVAIRVAGLYVIGDSILRRVPYARAAGGTPVKVRQWAGWTMRFHQEMRWPSNGTTTLEDAGASRTRVVHLQLGVNEIACLRDGPACPSVPQGAAYRPWAAELR